MNAVNKVCLNYLLSHTAYFALTTVAGVYLNASKDLPLSETALLVALLVFSHRGARFFMGPFLGTFNLKGVMAVGTGASLAGLVLLLVGSSLTLLIPSVILIGCGYSIRGIAVKSYLTVLSTDSGDHLAAFSQLNWFLNAAGILGPLAGGGLLLLKALPWVPIALIGLNLLALLHLGVAVSPLQAPASSGRVLSRMGLDQPRRDLAGLLASVFLFHAFLSLMFEILPFYLVRYTALGDGAGALLVLNGVMVVTFQRLCTRWTKRRRLDIGSRFHRVFFSVVPASVTLVLLMPEPLLGACLYVFLLSCYEMVEGPLLDAAVCRRVAATGAHGLWSFTGLSAAMGEGVAVLVGFQLLGQMTAGHLLPWFWAALAALEALAGLFYIVGMHRAKGQV